VKFFEAWKSKGLNTKYRSQWSAVIGDRSVFTIWNNPFGDTEVHFDKTAKRSTFESTPGAWSRENPGVDYIKRARQCMNTGTLGEVLLLQGRRDLQPSSVESVEAVPNLFYIQFTRVEDDGLMEGVFVPKGGCHTEGEEQGTVSRNMGKTALAGLVDLDNGRPTSTSA